jgi:hypothetical protein
MGASSISPPVCAECGKHLRTFRRRGEHWYCAVCGARPRPCASCGQDRIVATVDRRGQSRCSQCPDHDPRDPVALRVEVITRLDPTLAAETITAAAHKVHSRPAKLRRLGWAIEDAPDLLAGRGAHAPLPGVLRLIDGLWCCPNCVAKSRAQPCVRCGAVREAATRDENGRPLCPYCLITDPADQETCISCGERRRVSVRTPSGPLCEKCRPVKTMTCSTCGQHAPFYISKATGEPWCETCRQRWARCTACGQQRPVRGGTLTAPLCAAPAILRALADQDQPLSHETLDELPPGKTVEHLRSVLVATDTLPPRDEQLARLERWICRTIAERTDPDQRQLLHRYAVWHVIGCSASTSRSPSPGNAPAPGTGPPTPPPSPGAPAAHNTERTR